MNPTEKSFGSDSLPETALVPQASSPKNLDVSSDASCLNGSPQAVQSSPSSPAQAEPELISTTPASSQDSTTPSRSPNDDQTDSSEELNNKTSAVNADPSEVPTDSAASLPAPTNNQLLDAILPIRSEAPTLGVPKLLSRLKALNPSWQLSEKRLRKFLNSNPNLSAQTSNLGQARSSPRVPSEPIWLPDYAWDKDWEAASADNSSTEPVSSLDDVLLLECRQRSVKVEPVRFPESNKGSGLIAKANYPKGTQIIKEDAALSRSVISGQSCAFCGRAFSTQRTKSQPTCPHHPAPGSKEAIAAQQLVTTTSTSLATGSQSVTEKPAGPEPCYMRYCTRVCAQRSVDYYGPLVCPQKNPEYMQVIRLADSEEFRGAHMVFKIFARMLIANETGEISPNPSFVPPQREESEVKNGTVNPELEQDPIGSDDPALNTRHNNKNKKAKAKKKVMNVTPEWTGPSVEFEKIVKRLEGLATVSERARRDRLHGGGHLASHFTDVRFGQLWRNGWHVVTRALHLDTGYRPAPTESETNSTDGFWATFWKRRLNTETIAHYFGFRGFLEYLGKAALNRETDHGLYLLHARFNPLKHPGSEELHKIAPSTIYVIAKRDIQQDEEITISYINPELCLEARRKKLFDDYLFSCFCSRCRRELKEEEVKRLAEETSRLMMNGAIQEIGSDEAQEVSSPTTTALQHPNGNDNGNANGNGVEDDSMIDECQ
ncbi:uncharacterized protein MELLADRAFT_78855 [Melampsora larici-populina 98AG31]|uniref:Histone-lysine N-methyltransferase SET5 n=1 Tax=Melampsora larici-populina (strain 98AG31 / pathotype 3-4-7) TaxID=747676 RepID=F4RZU0_MELLP|nr:uncharacterized protein MELLADRAFT_78855 [Melampsora larici-populina 98AG31]EGG02061.1 hypothetical protein MELLADRAFT_78855 [Melampsora larici-populina 98AG31]